MNPAQAVQDITQRIERGYDLFFDNLKKKKTTRISRRYLLRNSGKELKYEFFTLKQAGGCGANSLKGWADAV
jgi:putative transposase